MNPDNAQPTNPKVVYPTEPQTIKPSVDTTVEATVEIANTVSETPKPEIKGRFVKGKSGNPLGRPKSTVHPSFKEIFNKELNKTIAKTENGDDVSNTEYIVKKLVEMALSGDLQAIKEVLDRTIGKPVQGVELSGESKIQFVLPEQSMKYAPETIKLGEPERIVN